MNEVTSLLGITIALAIGAASPGPSFLMVARTAAAHGRGSGLHAAFGMGIGALFFAIASLLGLTAILLAVPVLYTGLKLAGGLYLVYLGLRIWRAARRPLNVQPVSESDTVHRRPAFLLWGLATQVSNPKTAIVYASVFAAFMPKEPSLHFDVEVVALVFLIEAGWYAVVATALSAVAPRNAYLRYKTWIDRSAGGIMSVLGLKLASSAGYQ